ncbi:hypothetical protein JOD02_000701 [Caldicoprobacter guelmensis]|uniref:hypothetical protein n=1 Tax=Caldicoprobacter guelmensis TaxID=1170224 RepID=UPI0019580140|nr:hypothetical protein [Caldicoprobacter guelmensis]MBM7581864.1 hypothetical protein [Caldicoprobacter guelmensis]
MTMVLPKRDSSQILRRGNISYLPRRGVVAEWRGPRLCRTTWDGTASLNRSARVNPVCIRLRMPLNLLRGRASHIE